MDLNLIHLPLRLRHDFEEPLIFLKGDLLPFDIEDTLKAIEECC